MQAGKLAGWLAGWKASVSKSFVDETAFVFDKLGTNFQAVVWMDEIAFELGTNFRL